MAPKGNGNRPQKNGVRVALATGATLATLLGAQTLAFGEKTSTVKASQAVQALTITETPLAESTTIVTDSGVSYSITPSATATTPATSTKTTTKISAASTQPTPQSRSSRG